MENENFHVLEEEEKTLCPYKKFKFDDGPSFVTAIENNSNEKDNSIGDNGGIQQESAEPSEFDGPDCESENGEPILFIVKSVLKYYE